MADVIYVLINQAMPDLVKIGRTSNSIEQRMRELDTTGVPLPFECFSAWEVPNGPVAERAIHIAFGDHRIRERREFFRVSPDKPTAILKAFGLRNVTPGDDPLEDPSDQWALDRARSFRTPFDFTMVGLGAGAELTSVFDENERATVVSEKRISFRGQSHSLTSAALMVAHKNGKKWTKIQGPRYWKYEDETLVDLRNRLATENEDDE